MRAYLRKEIQQQNENICREAIRDFEIVYAAQGKPLTEQYDRALIDFKACMKNQCYNAKDQAGVQNCTVFAQQFEKAAKQESGWSK